MESKQGLAGKGLGKQSCTSTSTLPFDLPDALDMVLQIATGMEYLHEQGIVHGDLKTKNILVTQMDDGGQKSNVVKVTDFGLVCTKRKSKFIVSRKVRKLDTVRWKAPEFLKTLSRRFDLSNDDEDGSSSESESETTRISAPEVSSSPPVVNGVNMFAADVYSFAVTCSQILTGNSPYPDLDWKELMVKILSGWRPNIPDACDPLLRDLLMSCWGDPSQRPSFSAIRTRLKHVQGLLTTAMGKRPEEVASPSMAESPAHQAAVVASREVSTSFGSSLPLQPSTGPAVVPWASTMDPPSVTTVSRIVSSNSTGAPSAASLARSPPEAAAAPSVADDSAVGISSWWPSSLEASRIRRESLTRFSESREVAPNSRLEKDMGFKKWAAIKSTSHFSAEHSKCSFSSYSDIDSEVSGDEELAPGCKSTNIFTLSLLPGTSSYLNTRSTASASNLSYSRCDTRWSEGSDFRRSFDEATTTSSDLNTGPTMLSIGRGSNFEGTNLEGSFLHRSLEASEGDGGTGRVVDTRELERLYGDSSEAVTLTDERDTILWVNSAFQRLTKERTSSRMQAIGPHIDPLGIRTRLATLTFQPPFPASKCKAVMWYFLKKFIAHEGGASRNCDASANEVCSRELLTAGSVETGKALVPDHLLPSAFKRWRVLAPSERKREEIKNQYLLRRCFEMLRQLRILQWDWQQGIQTPGGVAQSISSQGSRLMSSCKTEIVSDIGIEHDPYYKVNPLASHGRWSAMASTYMPMSDGHVVAATHHVLAVRSRRLKLSEKFAALRGLVPHSQDKKDRVSILSDAIIYVEDLQNEINELQASKNLVESQYEDLKLSYRDLEQRNKQLEANKNLVDSQNENSKLSQQDLEQPNKEREASKIQMESQCEKLKLSYQDLEHRQKQLEPMAPYRPTPWKDNPE